MQAIQSICFMPYFALPCLILQEGSISTLNRLVVGSIPTASTIYQNLQDKIRRFTSPKNTGGYCGACSSNGDQNHWPMHIEFHTAVAALNLANSTDHNFNDRCRLGQRHLTVTK
jgi:hypothetical protein